MHESNQDPLLLTTDSLENVPATSGILPGQSQLFALALSEAELYARFFRGLGDPTRVRILQLLLVKELSVTEMVAALGVPQSRVSTHLGCLRWCGLVAVRRVGRLSLYRLADARVQALLQVSGEMMREHAAGIATCGLIR